VLLPERTSNVKQGHATPPAPQTDEAQRFVLPDLGVLTHQQGSRRKGGRATPVAVCCHSATSPTTERFLPKTRRDRAPGCKDSSRVTSSAVLEYSQYCTSRLTTFFQGCARSIPPWFWCGEG